MRTIALAFSLLLLAAPSQAAQKSHPRNNDVSLEQKCRDMVGREIGEGEGKSGINRAQVQRWDDCMMGRGQCDLEHGRRTHLHLTWLPGSPGGTQCPEPEVRAHRAANAIANFGFSDVCRHDLSGRVLRTA